MVSGFNNCQYLITYNIQLFIYARVCTHNPASIVVTVSFRNRHVSNGENQGSFGIYVETDVDFAQPIDLILEPVEYNDNLSLPDGLPNVPSFNPLNPNIATGTNYYLSHSMIVLCI